jgi:TusE/DsrC/DsvC family sulfur relay protein
MTTKTIANLNLEVTDEGYLVDASAWNKEIAAAIAKEEGIELTEKHFEVLKFIRNKVVGGGTLTIRGIGKSGVVDAKTFYQLFPGAPLKKATKIAGVAKPVSCM